VQLRFDYSCNKFCDTNPFECYGRKVFNDTGPCTVKITMVVMLLLVCKESMTIPILTLLITTILKPLDMGHLTYNDITYNQFYLILTLFITVNKKTYL